MDDVVFAHKPRLLDVAAQLKRSAHAALGFAINCAQSYQLQANTDARDYFSGVLSNFPGGSTGGGRSLWSMTALVLLMSSSSWCAV